ncbi:AraC family transcriptional regulator [Roseovarius sp. 2305UL8-3]|uniref:AraC family transcriptional regulator n=1 Tax=Roseovarius conchicola TaxID=3121636 RepID=UPI0035284756
MHIRDLIEPALMHLEEIKEKKDGELPNLFVFRADGITEFEAVVYNPVVCLILQGSKETVIGDQVSKLDAGDALVVSHDLPVHSKITMASADRPYLALILSLDLSVVRSLYEQVGAHLAEVPSARALSSGPANPELIGSIARYLALLDSPLDVDVLGPPILREVHYRLLMSPIGGMLRSLLSVDSHASRISKAILKIRSEYRHPLTVADLAHTAGMSQSSFHGHFKLVTGTTPLQYQKDLRMITARDLLRTGQHSVAAASFEVGYESPTHFSRDYHRKFGVAPSKEFALERA